MRNIYILTIRFFMLFCFVIGNQVGSGVKIGLRKQPGTVERSVLDWNTQEAGQEAIRGSPFVHWEL